MNKTLMEHLRGFEDRYPHKLEAQFAHIVVKIGELWDKPQITGYFSDLLPARHGDRQRFPPEIAREILALSVLHKEMRNGNLHLWSDERDAARKAIEELNLRLTPEHMLKAAELRDPARVVLFVKA